LRHSSPPRRRILFSRANARIVCAEYKAIISELVGNDPLIFDKSPRAQFLEFITIPFSTLQMRGHHVSRKPLVVILDGLDECEGMDAQCEFVEMIREAMTMKDLPILWLIVSRPEPHLRYLFTRVDHPAECNKHQLSIDAETREDVGRFVRDRLNEIGAKYLGAAAGMWPASHYFDRLVKIADGLFALATAMLNYIGDVTFANPAKRLHDLLAFYRTR
jgi:hypothetical protein